jgi:hypothetical protein
MYTIYADTRGFRTVTAVPPRMSGRGKRCSTQRLWGAACSWMDNIVWRYLYRAICSEASQRLQDEEDEMKDSGTNTIATTEGGR